MTLLTKNLWRKLRYMSTSATVTIRISKTKTKRLTAGEKSGRNLICRWRRWRFRGRFWRWRCRRWTKRRNKFTRSKISSSTSAMWSSVIFPPAQRTCNFDTSADRNVCNSRLCDRLRLSAIIWKQLSLRSSATCDLRSSIVCDRMETSLY